MSAHRIPQLDGLRGIAVLIVVGAHAGLLNQRFSLQGGNLGVDLFFALSGYLITSLLLAEYQKTKTLDLKAFYIRRALRLLPAVTVLCGFYALYVWRRGHEITEIAKTVLCVQFYLVNWAMAFGWPVEFGSIGHTWSLSIEEQFYLLWPATLLFSLRRIERKRLALLLTSGALAVGIWRAWLYWTAGNFNRVYSGFDTHSDAILMGCAVALWPITERVPHWLMYLAGGFICWQATRVTLEPFYGQMLVVSVAAAVLLVHLRNAETSLLISALRIRPLVWLGQTSYSLYLWHLPVVMPVRQSSLPIPVKYVLYVGLSLAAASLSYYGIERPFLRLKDRWRTRSSQQATESLPSPAL